MNNTSNTNTFNSGLNNVKNATSDLKDEAQKTASDVKDVVKEGAKDTKEALKQACEKGKETLEERFNNLKNEFDSLKSSGQNLINKEKLKHSLHQCSESVGKKCKASTEAVSEKISNQPMKSALIIGVVGFLLGAMSNRRS